MTTVRDNFTDAARKALSLAKEEAGRFSSKSIGPEYLLIGLLRVGDSRARMILQNLDIEIDRMRRAVEAYIRPDGRDSQREIGLILQARQVIESAQREALLRTQERTDTDHLLLALAQAPESFVTSVLQNFGARPEQIRAFMPPIPDQAPPSSQD